MSQRTQNYLLLLGIPAVTAAGFVLASGYWPAVLAAIVIFPHAFAGLIVWGLLRALQTGVLHVRGGSYDRSVNPIYFWLCFAIYVAVAIAAAAAAIFVDYSLLTDWPGLLSDVKGA